MTLTPRTDAAEAKISEDMKWWPRKSDRVYTKDMEELEIELSTLLANLERLSERWELPSGIRPLDTPLNCVEAAAELRRVFAGETPPEAGKEWA